MTDELKLPTGEAANDNVESKDPNDIAEKASVSVEQALEGDPKYLAMLERMGIEDTSEFVTNLRAIVDEVSKTFDVNLRNTLIGALEGKAVGKSEGTVEGKRYLDPWALLDVARGCHVWMHEEAHIGRKGKIQYEAVVDAYAYAMSAIGRNCDVQEPPHYSTCFEAYERFLARIDDGSGRDEMAKKVWEICSEKKYPELFAMNKAAMDKAKTAEERTAMFQDFTDAFPGLTYTDGKPDFGRREMVEAEPEMEPEEVVRNTGYVVPEEEIKRAA